MFMEKIKALVRSRIFKHYAMYFINGSILGIVALELQSLIFEMVYFESRFFYPLSVAFTCSILIPINFFIQRKIIFKKKGQFLKFIMITFSGIFLVSITSSLIKGMLSLFLSGKYIEQLSFILAALIISLPIFLLKRSYVFRVR